jgi:histidinol-phosphate/aromatic aminotransferase/cobyric acid decarboxylase-like protein
MINLAQNVCYDRHIKIDLDIRQYVTHADELSALTEYYNYEHIEVGYLQDNKLSMRVCQNPWYGATQFNVPEGNDVYYLINPNGNDGTILTKQEVLDMAKNYKYLIVDEAYGDFADESVIDEHVDNIIVLKTLSKSYAMPGARFGWCIANKTVIEYLRKYRPICATMPKQTLKQILNDIPNHAKRMIETRNYLEQEYDCVPSKSNYVLFKQPNKYTQKFGYKNVNGLYRMSLIDMETLNGPA